jgi:hypothetical protein
VWAVGAVALYGLGVVLWRIGKNLHRLAASDAAIRAENGFVIPQYYVSYVHGFVRRGLPGEVLSVFTPATVGSTSSMFWVLTGFGDLAVLLTIVLVARCASGTARRAVVAASVALSPFSLIAANDYLGRYDTIGLLLIVGIAFLGRRPPGSVPVVASALILVASVALATLSEEFLVLFVVPVVGAFVARQYRPRSGHWRRGSGLTKAALVAGPPLAVGAGVALASFLVTAPAVTITHAQRAYGVPEGLFDAASALSWTLGREFRYARAFGLNNLLGGILIWAAIFVLVLALIGYVVGVRSRWYWISGAYLTLVTGGLSCFGIDWRRWWLIAFSAAMATLALLQADAEATGPGGGRGAAIRSRPWPGGALALAAILALTVASTEFSGVFPVNDLVTRIYWKSDLTHWVPGHHGLACAFGLSASRC